MTAAPPRILLIDDDPAYAALVAALLPDQLDGAQIIHEATLDAGARRLHAEPFDCVLLDNELPDGRGVERIERLRADAPATSVVLLSGRVDDELAVRAMRLGAQDALRKGVEVDGLLGRAVQVAIERVRAQDHMRGAAAQVTGIVDHAPDSIFVKDLDGRYVLVNAAWSRATGILPDDARGHTDAELFPPARAEQFRSSDLRALAAGGPVRLELAFGEITYAQVKFPLRTEDGAVVGVCGISTDVGAVVRAEAVLAQERRHHQLVLANLPDMAVTLFDRGLRVMVMEGDFARRRGHDAAASVGQHISEVFPNVHSDFEPLLRRGLRGETFVHEYVTPDGVPIELTIVPQREDGEVEGVLLLTRDVTAARAAEAARAAAETHAASAVESSPIGMAIASLDGVYQTANPALCRMLGRDDLRGMNWTDLTHPDDREENTRLARSVVDGQLPVYNATKRYLHADGHEIWVEVNASLMRDTAGAPTGWFAHLIDVSERRRFEERLERMAHHDPLTGLINRRGFERSLAEHVARAKRYGDGGALLVLDLDGLKVINDTLGHSKGDELILAAATALAARVRESDVLACLGGDEFAVLLPHAQPEDALHLAELLRQSVAEVVALETDGRRRGMTASIGVVTELDAGRTAEALMAEADLAMLDAKEAGGDRVVQAGEGVDGTPQMRDRVVWLERLRGAIEDERFVLHAQPIIDVLTGAVDHFELLIRLPDGEGGLVPPMEFLPIAERAGMIVDLDRWVLRTAMGVLASERLAGRPRRFSVNLSARSIGEPAVLHELELGLSRPGADPRDLVMEMTETAAIGDVHRARRFADRLRELGVSLSLDDFGVGFGSFYELKHLPCDEVKIDGEFVRDCATDPTDRLVIRSLVELAGALGKRTVAEFVHDLATAETVRALGVDLGQGFHLGRPMPLDQALLSVPATAAAS